MAKISKSDAEWQQQLDAEQYRVTRKCGTEMAFTGQYYDHKEKGTYVCICCEQPLFSSAHKYDSGSGWPSYWQPVDEQCVRELEDTSHGMRRVEVRCSKCDAHLGHVFEDGPPPTGLRYCINSASLTFKPATD
jgi:peptide-methionine (R)-S-oxide reductase